MNSVVSASRKYPRSRFAASCKMSPLTLGLAIVLILTAVKVPGVAAEEVRLPVAENVRQGQQKNLPGKGISMATVESRFGEPQRRTDAIGQPPISQWHYEEFVVYFENSHVIHAVARRQQD